MNERISMAEGDLSDAEESIGDILEAFDSQTEYGHLIKTEYPDGDTIIIRFPSEIKICKDCDALYDTKRGCECQN